MNLDEPTVSDASGLICITVKMWIFGVKQFYVKLIYTLIL